MTLLELSEQYRANAAALKGRILELRRLERACTDEQAQRRLAARIALLLTMWREAGELAVLCRRYYERGYHRNEKYTL